MTDMFLGCGALEESSNPLSFSILIGRMGLMVVPALFPGRDLKSIKVLAPCARHHVAFSYDGYRITMVAVIVPSLSSAW